MTGPKNEYEKIYLKPAELCISRVPTLVTTILGSCVSVTMRSPKLGVAAICHALQPACPKLSMICPEHCLKKYQYVSCVIPEMIRRMEAFGASREALDVKIFGGAAVLATPFDRSIGWQNITATVSILEHLGIGLKAHQVGGRFGRKIIFDTHTGEVKIKTVRYSAALRSIETGQQKSVKEAVNHDILSRQ